MSDMFDDSEFDVSGFNLEGDVRMSKTNIPHGFFCNTGTSRQPFPPN